MSEEKKARPSGHRGDHVACCPRQDDGIDVQCHLSRIRAMRDEAREIAQDLENLRRPKPIRMLTLSQAIDAVVRCCDDDDLRAKCLDAEADRVCVLDTLVASLISAASYFEDSSQQRED